MNSDVPSSEHELSQDGSSQNDSNENSLGSQVTDESSNQGELSDNPEVGNFEIVPGPFSPK